MKEIEPVISSMPDGVVKIQFDNLTGYVSSYHLVQPKLNQLQAASLKSKLHDNLPASARYLPAKIEG